MGHRSRERVARILSHSEADRVPYCAVSMTGGTIRAIVDSMDLSQDHRAFCLEGDFEMAHITTAPDREAFAPYLGDVPEEASLSQWGVGALAQHTEEGHSAGSVLYHPLAHVDSVDELKRYPFPDLAKCGADEGLDDRVQALKEQEYTVMGQMSQTILETAYCMRGLPQLMVDFYERPKYVEVLLEMIAEQRRFQARRFAEADVDILRIGDDIATQENLLISPALYRERIKPLHASVIAAARAVSPNIHVKYHSDGNLTPLLPDLIEIGVTIINPVQPECMDIAHIKREFGKDLTLWGCMPVQSTWPHGSRDDVLRHLDFLMREAAPGGGFVAKFTNFLATEKSLENLRTFFEVFYEMGRYDSRRWSFSRLDRP